MMTVAHRRCAATLVACLMALIVAALLAAGCSRGQEPTSDTPGKKAAPDTKDRTRSK